MGKGLAKFKVKYMTLINALKTELLQKYPDKAERIKYIVDTLMNKLYTLKGRSLPDFIHTLYLASKEFPEFERLIPKSEELDELIEIE
jgi:hypothetical protein